MSSQHGAEGPTPASPTLTADAYLRWGDATFGEAVPSGHVCLRCGKLAGAVFAPPTTRTLETEHTLAFFLCGYVLPRRYRLGVSPVIWRKKAIKALSLAKPKSKATPLTFSPEASKSTARKSRQLCRQAW